MKRRAFLAAPLLLARARAARAVDYPARGAAAPRFAFPRDHGSHPAFRTEWWYVTGWVQRRRGDELGVQVTFFRNRPGVAEDNPSAFAPRQLLFAHAALADPRTGGCGTTSARRARASASPRRREDTTDVSIDDWSLALADGAYAARIAAREFALDLAFAPTQPLLLAGRRRAIRARGPMPRQASYYYSRPQLAVSGHAHARRARRSAVTRHGVARSRMVERIPGARARWAGTGSASISPTAAR